MKAHEQQPEPLYDQQLQELEQLRLNLRAQQTIQGSLVSIGDYTYGNLRVVHQGTEVHLTIGKFCSIAANVQIIMDGNHRVDWATTYPFNVLIPSFSYIEGHPGSNGDINIGNDVWLGSDSKIMSGVTIGDGAVVAANALVITDVEPYAIYGGVPAKRIKYRFEEDLIARLQEMAWWDWDLADLVEAIPLLQSNEFDRLYAYYNLKVKMRNL